MPRVVGLANLRRARGRRENAEPRDSPRERKRRGVLPKPIFKSTFVLFKGRNHCFYYKCFVNYYTHSISERAGLTSESSESKEALAHRVMSSGATCAAAPNSRFSVRRMV